MPPMFPPASFIPAAMGGAAITSTIASEDDGTAAAAKRRRLPSVKLREGEEGGQLDHLLGMTDAPIPIGLAAPPPKPKASKPEKPRQPRAYSSSFRGACVCAVCLSVCRLLACPRLRRRYRGLSGTLFWVVAV